MRSIINVISLGILIVVGTNLLNGEQNPVLFADPQTEQELKYLNQNPGKDQDEGRKNLIKLAEITNKYQENAQVHQVIAKILYEVIGDYELAAYEIKMSRALLTKESLADSLLQSKEKDIKSLINEELNPIEKDLENNYTTLRFKIKDIIIPRLCMIRDTKIVFRYDEKAVKDAEMHKILRLEYLKQKLVNIDFQFSSYDPIDREVFFEITYFPIIQAETENIFSITINNARRYRFDVISKELEPIEVDWLDFDLIESVPEMTIELIHDPSLKLAANNIGQRQYFYLDENKNVRNSYIPVQQYSTIEVKIEKYPRMKFEQFIQILSKVSVVGIIIATFIIVR